MDTVMDTASSRRTQAGHAGPVQINAFRKNPMGVAFDPEGLVKAYEAGLGEVIAG